MSTDARDRDWDAEFEQITRHLEAETTPDAPRRGAHRDLFDHSPATSSPAIDAPGGSEALDASRPGSSDLTPRTPHDDRAPRGGDPVPGFRAQWRIPHDAHDALMRTEPAHPAHDEEFVPPEPAPLQTGDPAVVIMLGCFLVGPLWLVYLTLFDRDAASLWWMLAAGVLVGGFALAVARQPKNRDEEDDDDDGARV